MTTREKNCYCHTCKKDFHWLGITAHRAMHRDKKEVCKITFTHGDTYTYNFSTKKPWPTPYPKHQSGRLLKKSFADGFIYRFAELQVFRVICQMKSCLSIFIPFFPKPKPAWGGKWWRKAWNLTRKGKLYTYPLPIFYLWKSLTPPHYQRNGKVV